MIFRAEVPADPLGSPFDGAKDDGSQFIGHAGAISQRGGLVIANGTYGDDASLTSGP